MEALIRHGYRMACFELNGLNYFRWHWKSEHGGGYLTEDLAWQEAARHHELTALRRRSSH